MKKVVTFISALWLCSISAFACGASVSDYYTDMPFFQFSPYDRTNEEKYYIDNMSETVNFWYSYFKGKTKKSDIESLIKENNDQLTSKSTEWSGNSFYKLLMKPAHSAALKYINLTFEMSESLNSWEYDEEEVNTRSLVTKLDAIKGMDAKLSERAVLLKMQCLYNAGEYDAVSKCWDANKGKISNSRLRDRMNGFMAGVMYKSGQYEDALAIYDAIGDYRSCKWVLSKMAGYKQLEAQVNKDVNSVATLHLLDRYINAAERAHAKYHDNLEVAKKYGMSPNQEYKAVWNATLKELALLDKLAEKVIREGNAKDVAMWYSVRVETQIVKGDFEKAMMLEQEAERASGTEYSKDVLRAQNLIIRMRHNDPWLPEFDKHLTKEFAYFYEKAVKEYKDNGSYPNLNFVKDASNYHFCVLHAYLSQEIKQYMDAQGRAVTLYLLTGAMEKTTSIDEESEEGFEPDWNPVFGTEKAYYFYDLDSRNAMAIYNALKSNNLSDFDRYLYDHAGKENLEFLRDACGVALLREGNTKAALEMFDGLSDAYLRSMNVMSYVEAYSLDASGLFGKSKKLSSPKVRNARKEACELLLKEENTLRSGDKHSKALAAYSIANIYYQISNMGKLWGVGAYSASSSIIEDTYTELSKKYIKECLKNADTDDIRANAHFANAVLNYNNSSNFTASYSFFKSHPDVAQPLCKSCDWLNDYVNGGFPIKGIYSRCRNYY